MNSAQCYAAGKELGLNALVMLAIAAPLFLVDHFWGMKKHWILATCAWAITSLAVHIWLLPRLGLQMNQSPSMPWW